MLHNYACIIFTCIFCVGLCIKVKLFISVNMASSGKILLALVLLQVALVLTKPYDSLYDELFPSYRDMRDEYFHRREGISNKILLFFRSICDISQKVTRFVLMLIYQFYYWVTLVFFCHLVILRPQHRRLPRDFLIFWRRNFSITIKFQLYR